MGEFINVEIDVGRCVGIKECGRCIRVCSVNIFGEAAYSPVVVQENEDECVLCNLCIEGCHTDAIMIQKCYEKE